MQISSTEVIRANLKQFSTLAFQALNLELAGWPASKARHPLTAIALSLGLQAQTISLGFHMEVEDPKSGVKYFTD